MIKAKINAINNLLLLISGILVIISGLLHYFKIRVVLYWQFTHVYAGILFAIFLIIHLILHAKWFLHFPKILFPKKPKPELATEA